MTSGRTLPLRIIVTPGMGGANSWAYRFRERVSGLGREVSLICRGDGDELAETPDFAYRKSRDLARWLQSTGPAIVLPNWTWSALTVCRHLRARGLDLTTVAYCRSHDESEYYSRIAAHLDNIDWLVAVSMTCFEELVSRFPSHRGRTVFLPTFVSRPTTALDRTYCTTPIRLLYTGRFEQEHKRVLDLVALGDTLVRKGVNFVLTLAGSGSKTSDILGAMARVPHRGRIRVVGELDHREVYHLYAEHDVFVQASDTEGLSNSMLEAMGAGLVPLVTRASSGVEGIIRDGKNGFTVPVGDVEAMSAIIELLVRNPSLLASTAAAAYRSTDIYAWDEYCKRLTAFLLAVENTPTSLLSRSVTEEDLL